MELKWILAAAIIGLMSACASLLQPGPDGELTAQQTILTKQMETLERNFDEIKAAVKEGRDVKPELIAALDRQLAALQSQQKALEKALVDAAKKAGISPEVAGAGGAVGAALLAQLLGLFRGLTSRRKETGEVAEKLSRAKKELFGRAEALEKELEALKKQNA